MSKNWQKEFDKLWDSYFHAQSPKKKEIKEFIKSEKKKSFQEGLKQNEKKD